MKQEYKNNNYVGIWHHPSIYITWIVRILKVFCLQNGRSFPVLILNCKWIIKNEISTPDNMRKMVLHENLPLNPMSIYWFSFLTAAMLDFAHNGHQGATPTCFRSVLETFDPYLHTCKISETCHQVHDFLPVGDIPTLLYQIWFYTRLLLRKQWTWWPFHWLLWSDAVMSSGNVHAIWSGHLTTGRGDILQWVANVSLSWLGDISVGPDVDQCW